ncbi:Autoinducer 1 sensor kinase/phosphatase LuxN (Partial), partial [Seminavis robusta]
QASSSADAKKKEDTFLHEVCVDVQENANTAVQMLNDILDYDKVESSTLKLELDNVPIWTLISKTIQQFQVQALGSHVALRLKQDDSRGRPKSLNGEAHLGRPRSGSLRDFESGVHCAAELEATTVIGDGTKLGQVFRNIISNALKFTPPDGTINVRAIHVRDGLPSYQLPSSYNPTDYESQQPRRAGSIRIQFKDSGVGMTREQLGKLFNEGIQFDVNRLQNGGGSGLGLVISKGIVEQHGGTVSVTSGGIGHGTTFTVELPLFHLPSEPSKTMDDSTAASIVSVEEPPEPTERRVLVVDDVMSNRKMLVRLLERAGHTCDTATNGEAAIRAVEGDIGAVIEDRNHVPFDCILMDYEMPIMNGPDATERIRDLGFGGLILGVTGNVLAEDTDHFLSKGADEIIAKPVKIAKLQESWERLTPSRKRKWSESKDGNVDSQQQRLFDV